MSFLYGFADELVKSAGPGPGLLGRALGRMGHGAARAAESGAMRRGLGRGLAVGGAAGAGAAAIGAKMGKKKGYEQGTAEEMDVAQQARQLGRREGVMAYHEALQERLRAQGG